MGVALNAQTNYQPTILSVDIPYQPGSTDTIHRTVLLNMTGWDNKQMKFHLVRTEFMNDNPTALRKDEYTFHKLMDSTYTHVRDNGNSVTNTGRWFTETIFEGAAINWTLFQELGRSIYFEYWDVNQEFIIKD